MSQMLRGVSLYSYLSLFFVLSVHSFATAEQEMHPIIYSSINSLNYSESLPIHQLLNDMEGSSIDKGSFAFTHNQFELGYKSHSYQFGVFTRYDYFLEFSPDTAFAFYLENNRLPFPEKKTYKIDLFANELLSKGLFIGKTFKPLNNKELLLNLRLNYLYANKMTYGSLKGNIKSERNILDEQTLTGDVFLDYSYTEDKLLSRPTDSLAAQGFSIDLNLSGKIQEKFIWHVKSKDLYSTIFWENVSHTDAKATSDTFSFDDDGVLITSPAISGKHSNRNIIQRLPIQLNAALIYKQTESLKFGGSIFQYDKHYFPKLNFSYHSHNWGINTTYTLNSQALSLGFKTKYLAFSINSDSIDIKKAKTLGFNFSISKQYRF